MGVIDREKIINALERCINGCDSECPYEYGGAVTLEYCRDDLMRDALELLKEQEYARCMNCQFRDFGENEVDSWDICKLHRHNTSPDEYCSWFVEKAVKWNAAD